MAGVEEGGFTGPRCGARLGNKVAGPVWAVVLGAQPQTVFLLPACPVPGVGAPFLC